MRKSLPLALLFFLGACGGTTTVTVGNPDADIPDANGTDASPDDAGNTDATPPDAGGDATQSDTGPGQTDASQSDSSTLDAPAADSAIDLDGATLLGADAGTFPDANIACAAIPGPHPLWLTTIPGVSITADGSKTLTVPDGFQITANIGLAAPPPAGATWSYSGITTFDLPTGQRFSAPDVPVRTVSVVLPAGPIPLTYSVSYGVSGTSITRAGYQILDVCGDATLDVVLPAFPALTSTTLTLDHLDNLGSVAGGQSFYFTLTTPDGTFSASSLVNSPAGATSVSFAMTVPLGVPLIPQFGANKPPLDILPASTPTFGGNGPRAAAVTIAGAQSISVPPQVTLSGTVTDSDPFALSGSVACYEGTLPSISHLFPPAVQDSPSVLTGTSSPFSYALAIGQGTTCTLRGIVGLTPPAPDGGSNQSHGGYLISPFTTQSVAANAIHDFAFPSAGTIANLTINVVDARGNPLYVLVYADSTALAGAAFAGYGFDAMELAFPAPMPGASMSLIPGTYEFIVAPRPI